MQPRKPPPAGRQALGCLIILGLFLGLGLLGQIPDLLDPEAAEERRRAERERLADRETERILQAEEEHRQQLALRQSLKVSRGAAPSILYLTNESDVTFTSVTVYVYPSVAAYQQSGTDVLFGGPLAPHRLRRPIEIPPGESELDLSVLVKGDERFRPRVDPVGVVSIHCDQGELIVGFE